MRRGTAIAVLCDVLIGARYQVEKDAINMAIEALSAEAEWIPCSERLPSEDGDYLVQMSWWGFQMDVYSWADGWNCYRINGKVSRLSEIDGRDIVAWMPLPKPYREDGEA